MNDKRVLMGQSFEMLPRAERAQQYREMADATFLKAQKLQDTALRTQYLDMAANWHALQTRGRFSDLFMFCSGNTCRLFSQIF